MQLVIEEFHVRVAEIKAYSDFVANIDKGETKLRTASDSGDAYSPTQQGDLLRTFKASALLMLYNLMESAVTNAVESIFDELEKEAISFDICREEIRLVVLGNLRQHDPRKLVADLNALATDIVIKTFRKDEIVSGNVDARRIRDVAKQYGFLEPTCRGDRLLAVKSHRNDLAHGSKSFAEVGRLYSVSDIQEIECEVIAYLTEMLTNVAEYLTTKGYLLDRAS